MIVKPTVSELLNTVGDNRYSLVIMTAKRARQIASGDQAKTKAKGRGQALCPFPVPSFP